MSTLMEELTAIKAVEDKLTANKVANFAYTDHAYNNPLTEADGVSTYDVSNEQNIPVANADVLKVNPTVLTKGWRAQASSITRMLMNHFLGRCSYNLNKLNDLFSLLLTKLITFIGSANGIASLDANARIPDSQLPSILSMSDNTITGKDIITGDTIRVRFTSNLTGQDTSTALTLTYDETSYPVKAYKDGALVSIYAKELTAGNYTYIHAGIFLDLFFDGEEFIVVGNPVVLSTIDSAVYANGKVGNECLGTVKAMTTVTAPYGWKVCDGQAISRTEYKDLFECYRDQTYDSNPAHTLLSRYGTGDGSTTFNLPDYREVSLVGTGSNSKDSPATHDTYTQGEFKDDQLQNHGHGTTVGKTSIAVGYGTGGYTNYIDYNTTPSGINLSDSYITSPSVTVNDPNSGRHGSTTRGKRKGVTFIVKVYA